MRASGPGKVSHYKARWPSKRETPGRSGKFMPLISYNASVGINKNSKNKQQKQRSHHDTWNTCHAWNTHSTNGAGKSTGSIRDTIPRQQDKNKRQQEQQQIPYYFGGIPKIRGYLLFVLWPWPKQEKSSLFFRWSSQWQRCPSDGQCPRLGARCKVCSDTCWYHHQYQFLILIVDSSH